MVHNKDKNTPIVLEAIRASAGAGKTYTLTIRYLNRLMKGAPVAAILATTFTRKAAGEISERVFLRLAEAVLDPEKATALAEDLGRPKLKPKAFEKLLLHLTSSMHRLMISTIDSYFNRLAQAFRYELGLPADLELAEGTSIEVVRGRLEALRALLSDIDQNVLLNLLAMLHPGSARRSVTETLDRLVAQLYPIYRSSRHEDWERLIPPASPPLSLVEEALKQLEVLAENESGKMMKKALLKTISTMKDEDYKGALGSGLAAKVAEGTLTFGRRPISDAVLEAVQPVVDYARARVLDQFATQTRATAAFLKVFQAHYQKVRQHHGLVLFSELPLILAEGLDCDAEDIAHRLDASLDHLMLDEFQDTSPEQWAVLRPIALRIAGGEVKEGSLFCVGDVKQAIYGWRGGSAEIFDHLGDEIPDLNWEERSTSWRSSHEVLEAVNRVFSTLETNPALEKHRAPALSWQKGFHKHRPERKHRGYVELRTITSASGNESEEQLDERLSDAPNAGDDLLRFKPMDREAAALIADLAQRMPGAGIGVLVRTNDTVRRLRFLLQQKGVSASGEGGATIDDDPAVEVFLAALTLADHPGDRIAAFHVSHSPLGPYLGLDAKTPRGPETKTVFLVASHLRARLLAKGYASELSKWMEAIAPSCGRRSLQRLAQLLDLAEHFDKRPSLRAGDFVALVREKAVEEPLPARVRVMTVHKAKGLEFDIVVLLDLHRRIMGVPPPILVDRPDPMAPIQAVYRYPNQTIRRLEPVLEEAYARYEASEIKEGLCELYVAMTRARYALYMLVPPLKRRKDGTLSPARGNAAAILRGALVDAGFKEREEGGQILFALGDSAFYASIEALVKGGDEPIEARMPGNKEVVPLSDKMRGLSLIAPSHLSGGSRVSAKELLRLDTAPNLLRGTLMHAFFERIEWLEDGGPSRKDLSALAHSLASGQEEGWYDDLLASFFHTLSCPEVRKLLKRPALSPGESVHLWREKAFVVRHQDRLVQGRFDRVVFIRRGDKVRCAHVVDFKSGTFDRKAAEKALETYTPQLLAYRAALGKMLDVVESQIESTLLLEGGRVMTLR